MKQRKWNIILILLTAAFLLLSAGFCAGRTRRPNALSAVTARAPSVQETVAQESSAQESSALTPTTQVAAEVSFPLDLNTATAEELTALPGIGEVLAGRIVAYREEVGAFTSVEELLQVDGIGEKRFEAIRDYITLEENDENSGR